MYLVTKEYLNNGRYMTEFFSITFFQVWLDSLFACMLAVYVVAVRQLGKFLVFLIWRQQCNWMLYIEEMCRVVTYEHSCTCQCSYCCFVKIKFQHWAQIEILAHIGIPKITPATNEAHQKLIDVTIFAHRRTLMRLWYGQLFLTAQLFALLLFE